MLSNHITINTLTKNDDQQFKHINHLNSIHLNFRFMCDWSECHKQFTAKQYLNDHKKYVHLKDKTFTCNEENCGKILPTKVRLNRHKVIH
ncbi:unnamed protein product [Oppiella nova]|uniref:C2H2-type domain-containing protein n=1 Tax=Oppiella nova TaxID=334625 RepID=A0A7R9MQG0_9ACAR|nr:unnamed protein product [Oppiella nova]CAG2181185.1 unnamed protein product [Oppiella nova]